MIRLAAQSPEPVGCLQDRHMVRVCMAAILFGLVALLVVQQLPCQLLPTTACSKPHPQEQTAIAAPSTQLAKVKPVTASWWCCNVVI